MGKWLALVLATLTLAGCVSTAPAGPAAVRLDAMGMPIGELPPLLLNGTACTMGGGHSIHSHQLDSVLPEPWKPADVIEDIGVQPSYSDPGEQIYGVATSGWGNWHTTFLCGSWALNGAKLDPMVFGLVLTRVEPPSFDPAPVHRNYLVNVIASSDPALVDALMRAGWHAMPAKGVIDHPGGADIFHQLLDAGDHGVYESTFHTAPAGRTSDDVIRLWWQREDGDHLYTPVAIDMHVTKQGTRSTADVEGVFSHTRTNDHTPLPGAYGQIAGLVYDGIDVSLAWGPQLTDVKLDKAYEHL